MCNFRYTLLPAITLFILSLIFFLAFDFVGSAWSFGFSIRATTANNLRLRRLSIPELIHSPKKIYFKLYLFYNETSYTTYINHVRWHRCLRSDVLRVVGNRSARRKPTCLTWWPHDDQWLIYLILFSVSIICILVSRQQLVTVAYHIYNIPSCN